MYKSIFLEGFSRPEGGVRTIIKLLLQRLKDEGAEIEFNQEVTAIDQLISGLKVTVKDGRSFVAKRVLSSIGVAETYSLMKDLTCEIKPKVGKLSFVESILVFDKPIVVDSKTPTIIFYNNEKNYQYRRSVEAFSDQSCVFCLPDAYDCEQIKDEATVRITFIANYHLWDQASAEIYAKLKNEVLNSCLKIVKKLFPHYQGSLVYSDIFTPRTIKKFTSHFEGAVYGSEDKNLRGLTAWDNLFIIGTDQGFLGIVGAMLSGISMANMHVLSQELK